MANSKYEYVRTFEQSDSLLPNTWIVVRLDGRGFHSARGFIWLVKEAWRLAFAEIYEKKKAVRSLTGKSLSQRYSFSKPNDIGALSLMSQAACAVVKDIPDICVAYGVSDEYSFVLHKSTTLFDRRSSKLISTIVSTFTAYYIHFWPEHISDSLVPPHLPTFDARAVAYPTVANLRDYLAWRQVDCHVNNLYNTTFWAMRDAGMGAREAEEKLKGTMAKDKNEILWTYKKNYNDELEVFRKGSVVFREYKAEEVKEDIDVKDLDEARQEPELSKTQADKARKARNRARVIVKNLDIIKDDFWNERPWILSGKPGKPVEREELDR